MCTRLFFLVFMVACTGPVFAQVDTHLKSTGSPPLEGNSILKHGVISASILLTNCALEWPCTPTGLRVK